VPHPFRVFLRNGWDTDKIPVYTISEKALDSRYLLLERPASKFVFARSYSIFASALYRNHAAKWLFPQEKATFHSAKIYTLEAKML
jgi:hypothetical protein